MLSKIEMRSLQSGIARTLERLSNLPDKLEDGEKPYGLNTIINARIEEAKFQLETLNTQLGLAICDLDWHLGSDVVVLIKPEAATVRSEVPKGKILSRAGF